MTRLVGGKTVAVTHLSEPRCGTCGAKTFLKAERFEHSNEVRVTAVCDHGQANFMEDSRIFNGDAWDKRGTELVRESFAARSPFPKTRESKDKAPPPTAAPKERGAWFRKVNALQTGDVVVGPLADLQRTYLPAGQKAVIVSTTKGVEDFRVRYRTVPEERYGTFVCRGSLEVTMLGNEYLPNEAIAAGVVDELRQLDEVSIALDPRKPNDRVQGTVLRVITQRAADGSDNKYYDVEAPDGTGRMRTHRFESRDVAERRVVRI